MRVVVLLLAAAEVLAAERIPIEISPSNQILVKVVVNGRLLPAAVDMTSPARIELSPWLASELGIHGTGRLDRFCLGKNEYRNQLATIAKQETGNAVRLGWAFWSEYHTIVDQKWRLIEFSETAIPEGEAKAELPYRVREGGGPITVVLVRGRHVPFAIGVGTPASFVHTHASLAGKKASATVEFGSERIGVVFLTRPVEDLKTPGAAGIIGNDALAAYRVYFDPDSKTVKLY